MSESLLGPYERDGYCIVRNLFTPDEMRDWKERIVGRMTNRGWDRDPSGVRVWKVDDDLDPFFERELTSVRIASVLADIVGPEVEFLSAKPVFKNADVKFPSPWHHDRAYWGGSRKVSIWIALDDATPSNGCLKLVRGSHRIPVEMDSIPDGGGRESGGGFRNRIDEAAAMGLGLPVDTIEAARGDVIVFHDLTLHASYPNVDGRDRWSFIATYRDATVPDSSTVWDRALPVALAS